MNDTTRPALAASTALSTTATPTRSMAELVLEHAAAMAACDANEDCSLDPRTDPFYQRYNAACDALSAARCNSIPDMLAKIQAARLEGRSFGQDIAPEDNPNLQEMQYDGRWAWQVCMDLQRLFGGRRLQVALPPSISPDAELISAATEHRVAVEAFYAGDEHGAPQKYAVLEARYHTTLRTLIAAPPPTTMAGFQKMAEAILADATDPNGVVTTSSLQGSAVTQEMVLTLLRAMARPEEPAAKQGALAAAPTDPLKSALNKITVAETNAIVGAISRIARGPLIGTEDMTDEERLVATFTAEALGLPSAMHCVAAAVATNARDTAAA